MSDWNACWGAHCHGCEAYRSFSSGTDGMPPAAGGRPSIAYVAGFPLMGLFREWLFLGAADSLPRLSVSDRIRPLLLRLAGAKVGNQVRIWDGLSIRPVGGACRLAIGDGVFINSRVRFACHPDAKVVLGDFVQIGAGVQFETTNHTLDATPGRRRSAYGEDIIVESGVWIAAGAIVCPGVRIGAGSVVAAGAVVVSSVPPRSLVGGVPARVLRGLGGQR